MKCFVYGHTKDKSKIKNKQKDEITVKAKKAWFCFLLIKNETKLMLRFVFHLRIKKLTEIYKQVSLSTFWEFF